MIPPLPTYSHTLPVPSSTIPRNIRHSKMTIHWESFQRDTLNYTQTGISQMTNLVNMPVFPFQLTINDEVPALQMCVAQNLFDVVARHMGRTVWATERGKTIGNPDGYMVDDASQSNIFVYEIKGKWTLDPQLFERGRIDMFVGEDLLLDAAHSCLRNAINQIYTCMVVNYLQYGILSSFNFTFFLKRVKVENSSDGFEQLLISTGIAHNATSPTVLQCIAYFLSLADGTPFTSPPPSPLRQSPRTSRSSTTNSPSAFQTRAEPQNLTTENESTQQDADLSYENDFALEDFNIKCVLGSGRPKVYYEEKHQVALKAIDLWKQSDMLAELQNEIEIYRLLSDLQGRCIPKLVLYGYWEGGMYCIGFSLCGTVPKTLSESQKQSVLSIIDAIHDHGVLHNDIKRENILVDEKGRVYLIDFGFATVNSCEDAQLEERNRVLNCIESL